MQKLIEQVNMQNALEEAKLSCDVCEQTKIIKKRKLSKAPTDSEAIRGGRPTVVQTR